VFKSRTTATVQKCLPGQSLRRRFRDLVHRGHPPRGRGGKFRKLPLVGRYRRLSARFASVSAVEAGYTTDVSGGGGRTRDKNLVIDASVVHESGTPSRQRRCLSPSRRPSLERNERSHRLHEARVINVEDLPHEATVTKVSAQGRRGTAPRPRKRQRFTLTCRTAGLLCSYACASVQEEDEDRDLLSRGIFPTL
jgi:hypothetical protein